MGNCASPSKNVGNETMTWKGAPADLAHRIRRLAVDVHRVVNSEETRSNELNELSKRVDKLRLQTQDPQFIEINRWLEAAQNLIKIREQ
jgi:hypothetical protein